MKNTTSKKELKTKDGRVYPKGTSFEIKMIDVPYKDVFAVADPMNGDKPVTMRAMKLGRYFRGFHEYNINTMIENEEMDSCVCPSLTGKQVEPDGHDEYGFPSVLLAAGYL